jgi:hypothetical protein
MQQFLASSCPAAGCDWEVRCPDRATVNALAAEHMRSAHGQALAGNVRCRQKETTPLFCEFQTGGVDDGGSPQACGLPVWTTGGPVQASSALLHKYPVLRQLHQGPAAGLLALCPIHRDAMLQYVAYYDQITTRPVRAGARLTGYACEVCFLPLFNGQHVPSRCRDAPDGLGRGFFCSDQCRAYAAGRGGTEGFFGAPHVAWAPGDRVELWPHDSYFYANGDTSRERLLKAGTRGRVTRGTYLLLDPDEWLAWGMTSLLVDLAHHPSISMRGPVWAMDVEMNGEHFPGCYTGWFAKRPSGWFFS